ncbi:retrovirus-related pol polyprotein from transposon TNT 1-94 [Tanacetum coccineum]
MVLYNALPKKEYKRDFMYKAAKDIWQSLLITHQGNSQVKGNKIDLLVQQYEQFTILEEESIDSDFARFNTIITSLKALDEGFSSKNYARKFLRSLHPKWRAKVTAIEESKDLSSLALDELIGNQNDDETSTSGSDDEECATAKRSFRQRDDKKSKSDRKRFRCDDSYHLIGDCPKPPRNKDQKAYIGGCWSDSKNEAEDKTNDETCLMDQSSNEVTLDSSHYSDTASSFDDDRMKIEYNNLPKNANEALGDESWVVAMQEELNQIIANDVWDLVTLPKNQLVIGTKWVYRNTLDGNSVLSRNKARLVAQGYNQKEGIDYDETYAPVARLESIRILLAIACANDFKLYQMDVKSAFLNGFINKEVYVAQPPDFIDFEKPNYVYKLKKVLYGLKQAPKAKRSMKMILKKEMEFEVALLALLTYEGMELVLIGAMALMAFLESEVNNDKTCSNTYLKSFEALKTQLDNLRVEFNKSEFNLATYKRGLASVEGQLVFYKKNEVTLFAPLTIDLSNSGLKEFQQPEFKGYGFKANKGVYENSSNEIKKTTDAPIIKYWVLDYDEDDSEVMVLKSDNVQHKPQQANQPKKVSQNPRNNITKWNEIKTQKLGVGFQTTKKACFVCGSFNHLIKDCDFHDKKMVQKPVLNNVKKDNWNFVPTAVLTKSGIVPVSAARPIITTAPKSFVNAAKTRPNAFYKSHSLSRRPFYQQTTLKNKILNDKVNTAKVNFVNTAKGNRVTSAVGEQGINVVKSSAC